MFLVIAIIIVQGIIFGVATNAIISNKGYDENWFWWGFFFGIIAMLVALSKPEYQPVFEEDDGHSYFKNVSGDGKTDWKCSCGRVNPGYTGTCACGKTQDEIRKAENEREIEQQRKEQLEKSNLALDTLMKMKQLLDSGAITEEEFQQKKKELF